MYFRNYEQGLNDWPKESTMENSQEDRSKHSHKYCEGMPYQMHQMSSPWMENHSMAEEYDDDPDPRFRRRRRHHIHHHIHHHFIHHMRY